MSNPFRAALRAPSEKRQRTTLKPLIYLALTAALISIAPPARAVPPYEPPITVDKPGEIPRGTGAGAPPSFDLDEVDNCDGTQEQDIRAVAWNVADDWTNFDNAIEGKTSFRLGDCTFNRFSRNGKVECMARDNGRNGYSLPWTQTIKLYPVFLTRIADLPQPDRRACYAALMTHEFAHSCDRFEGRAEAREDAAFEYWKGRFSVSSDLDVNVDCGLD